MKTFSAVFFTLIFVTACGSNTATNRPLPSPEQTAQSKGYDLVKPVKQIRDYLIDGWNYIDRQNLVLHTSPSRSYLLTLKRSCNDLNSIEDIFINTRTGVLTAGLDAIKVKPRHGSIIQSCHIENIYLLKKHDKKKSPTKDATKAVAA